MAAGGCAHARRPALHAATYQSIYMLHTVKTYAFASRVFTIDGRPAVLSLPLRSTVDLPEPPPCEEDKRHHIHRHHDVHCSKRARTSAEMEVSLLASSWAGQACIVLHIARTSHCTPV